MDDSACEVQIKAETRNIRRQVSVFNDIQVRQGGSQNWFALGHPLNK